MSEERKINGINDFLQMSMINNMPLSVNEKRQIFDLIIKLQNQIKEVRETLNKGLEELNKRSRNEVYIEEYLENAIDVLDKGK